MVLFAIVIGIFAGYLAARFHKETAAVVAGVISVFAFLGWGEVVEVGQDFLTEGDLYCASSLDRESCLRNLKDDRDAFLAFACAALAGYGLSKLLLPQDAE